MPKDSFTKRWKKGIEQVTPLQTIKVNLFSYCLIFFGIAWGMLISFRLKTWWLFVILMGSLFISITQFIGMLQKYILLKRMEEEFEKTD